jgi:hypothetical protein
MSTSLSRARRAAALIAFGFALLFVGAAPGVAAADTIGATIPEGGGANNVVLVSALADASARMQSHVQVSQAGGNTIQSANLASALATGCAGCHSTAVAVQVVFVTGAPQYFVPQNAAVAVNSGCHSCGTFAYAWQYTPQVDRAVVLTPAGRQEVEALASEIDATAAAIVPDSFEDDQLLQSQLDSLTAQLKDVIDSQVTAAGAHAVGAPVKHVDLASGS